MAACVRDVKTMCSLLFRRTGIGIPLLALRAWMHPAPHETRRASEGLGLHQLHDESVVGQFHAGRQRRLRGRMRHLVPHMYEERTAGLHPGRHGERL